MRIGSRVFGGFAVALALTAFVALIAWHSLDTFSRGAATATSAQRLATESSGLALAALADGSGAKAKAVQGALERTRTAIKTLAEHGRGNPQVEQATTALGASVASVEAGAATLAKQEQSTEQLQWAHARLVEEFLVAVDRVSTAQQENLAQAVKSVDASLEEQARLSSLVAMAGHAFRLSYELRLGDEVMAKDEEIQKAKTSAMILATLIRKLSELPALGAHLQPALEAAGKYRDVILALEAGRDRQRELAPLSDIVIEALKGVDREIINMQSAIRSRMSDARDQVVWATELITLSGTASFAAKSAQVEEIELVRTGAENHAEAMDKAAERLQQATQTIKFRVKDPEITIIVEGLLMMVDSYRKSIPTILKAQRDTLGLKTNLAATVNGMVARAQQVGETELRAMERGREQALWLLGCGVACALLLGLLLAFLIGRGITRPVNALVEAMRKLAAGDLAADIPGADRKDELGEMGKAVLTFKEAGIEKVRTEQEAAAARRQADDERRAAEAARQAASEKQALVVSSLAAGLSHLAEGDLRYRLETEFASEYEQLRTDFNRAVDTLHDTVETIADAAMKIQSGTSEIRQASDDLSRRTEQQAASLEESAAALDEITATTRKAADSANHAQSLVGTAASEAERSGDVVREAIDAMGKIETSSDKIAQIVGVIDEIAFQTNLLALNAGVEAARAGETGKGFAVVAQEVRALAQRSATAAKEIESLIQTSSQLVDDGVKLVGDAGKALMRISGHVGEINSAVSDIAASAKEQAVGLDEVNTAVNHMDQMTQQNAAMVEQSTAANHGLAGEADELTRLLGHFKLDARQPAPALVPVARAPAARPAARPAPARSIPARTQGNLALSPQTEEDWEEF